MAGRITGDESLEELQDLVAKLQKDVTWLMDGNLSSKNVREIGGYQVSATLFQSRGGDVGLSSANDATDPVRLWAGSASKDFAPWRVHKSGIMYSTGGVFRSAAGYPRVELNSANNLVAAYSAPGTYIAFTPVGFGSVPAISLVYNNSLVGFLNRSVGGTTLGTFDGDNLNFQPSGNLQIEGTNGISGSFFVSSTPGGPTNTQVNFKKGIRTS